ncbi:MAG: EI24 domain-containing protein [Rhodospirillales bacterium]
MNAVASPLARALGQLNDRVFLGVLVQSLGLAGLSFFALHALALWIMHGMLELHGWLAWLVDIVGSVAASALTMWLFLPLAGVIATFFMDRIAAAVEARWYPGLPPAIGASTTSQLWQGLALGLHILGLNLLALLFVLTIPGLGLAVGWAVAAYGIGRGLFVAVAMRRMNRRAAERLYRDRRWAVLAQGLAMALAGTVPLLNLLIPVIGTAAMVHVLDRAMRAG